MTKRKIVIGVGGCTVKEIEEAVKFFHLRDIVLMFGFQNYPTKYEDVNLLKIRKDTRTISRLNVWLC